MQIYFIHSFSNKAENEIKKSNKKELNLANCIFKSSPKIIIQKLDQYQIQHKDLVSRTKNEYFD